MTAAANTGECWTCGGQYALRDDGTLAGHERQADSAHPIDQATGRRLVPCEGSGDAPAVDYARPCPHVNAAGEPVSCSEAERLHEQDRHHGRAALTIEYAGLLGQLIRAVEAKSGVKLRYYPQGTDSAERPLVLSFRAFVNAGDEYFPSAGADIRDLRIWLTGTFEHWLTVDGLVRALDNAATGKHGMREPMAIIDWEARS